MQHILLLHGAIGAADQLQPLADALSEQYTVHTMSFSGHGCLPFPAGPFSISMFAAEVISFIEQRQFKNVSIFGYSMGGYVAMYLAKQRPELLNKVVTLATKFHWTEEIATKEAQMLNADKIESKVPAFAAALRERHGANDWKKVLADTVEMLHSLGKDNVLKIEDYAGIQTPSLLLLGDRDKMITLEETVAVYKALPNAQMGLLPNTPHPIEQVDVELLAYFIARFA